MGRIITVTSGKGGVGKTNICLNLALYLATKGLRTCLFDADLGLANINILLGLQPELTLKDVILDQRPLQDIIIEDYEGIDILPGSSGVEELANLDASQAQDLVQSFSLLAEYDYLLFDTSAGIAKNVLSFCLSTQEVVVIITPEPTSLTDAYSLVKVLLSNKYKGKIYVVVNQCKDMAAAKSAYGKFKGAVIKYLGTEVQPLGVVFEDSKVVSAVKEQRPFFLAHPNCNASQCIKKIGDRLMAGPKEDLEGPDIQDFWRKCINIIQGPLKLVGKKAERQSKEEAAEDKTVSPQPKIAPPSVPSTESTHRGAEKEPVSQQGAVSSPGGDLTGHADTINVLLKELVRGISSVSEELRLFREVVQGNGFSAGSGKRPEITSFEAKKKPVIKLDIDGFLARKGTGDKG